MANPKIIFTGVDQASVVIGKVAGTVDKLKLALGGLASAAAVGVFKGIVDDLDRLEESAQSAGVAVESLSALRYAATFAGVGAEDLDEALKKLNVKLAEAGAGGKEAAAVFKALGISVRNSSGQLLSSDEALAQIADKFASFRDGPEKAALAVEIFGRSGTKLIPFLNQGAAGLERMKAEAEKLGIVIGTDATTAASKFADQLDRLAAVATAAKVKLFLPIIEGLNKMVEEFGAATAAANGFFEALKFLATQSAQTLADPGQKIEDLRKEIEAYDRKLSLPGARDPYIRKKLTEQQEALKREKQFLQEIQRNRALFNAGGTYSNEGRTALPGAPTLPGKGGGAKSTKEEITDAQRALDSYVESLSKAITKTEEMSEVEQALVFLRDLGTTGQIPQVRQLVLELAKKKDLAEQEIALQKELARQQDANLARDRQLDAQLEEFSGRAADALKVAQTARLEARLAAGELFSAGELDRIVKGIGGIKDEVEKTNDAAERFAMTLTSSVGAFLDNPSEGNFFQALLKDIEKLIVQMLVLEPLAAQLTALFKGTGGSGGGGMWSGLLSSLFGQSLVGVYASGTSYVPRTGLAMVHEGEAIIPAGQSAGTGTVNVYIDSSTDRAQVVRLVEAGVRAGNARLMDGMARRSPA
jgi:Phage-related minor tail protein